MSAQPNRILIFGAGVIGSAYAIKFIRAGMDVTMFARSTRFEALKEHGLQYDEKGVIKSIEVKVIDQLENDDVYDYIFVTVRYDKADAALAVLKDNQSRHIVTMISNSIGVSAWRNSVGDRLLPAFPGVGGQIKHDVLYARFPPKALAATLFGEVDGRVTERVKDLAHLFKTAKLPYAVQENMKSSLITHAVSDIALLGNLYSSSKLKDTKAIRTTRTAHRITHTLKVYLKAIQQAGVVISPAAYAMVLKFPNWILDVFFIIWLRTSMVKDMLLPDYASSASNEIVKLHNDLLSFLSQHEVTPTEIISL